MGLRARPQIGAYDIRPGGEASLLSIWPVGVVNLSEMLVVAGALFGLELA